MRLRCATKPATPAAVESRAKNNLGHTKLWDCALGVLVVCKHFADLLGGDASFLSVTLPGALQKGNKLGVGAHLHALVIVVACRRKDCQGHAFMHDRDR